jgi:hypothetical protein
MHGIDEKEYQKIAGRAVPDKIKNFQKALKLQLQKLIRVSKVYRAL